MNHRSSVPFRLDCTIPASLNPTLVYTAVRRAEIRVPETGIAQTVAEPKLDGGFVHPLRISLPLPELGPASGECPPSPAKAGAGQIKLAPWMPGVGTYPAIRCQ
jgi:hypothetical protein